MLSGELRRRPQLGDTTWRGRNASGCSVIHGRSPSLRAQRSDPSHHEIVRRRSAKSGRVPAASMTRGVSGRGAIKSAVKRRQNRGLLCYADKKQRAQRSGKPALSYPRKRVSSGTRRGDARLAPGGSSKQPKFCQRRGILDARVRGHDTEGNAPSRLRLFHARGSAAGRYELAMTSGVLDCWASHQIAGAPSAIVAPFAGGCQDLAAPVPQGTAPIPGRP